MLGKQLGKHILIVSMIMLWMTPAHAQLPNFTLDIATDSLITSVNLPQPKPIGTATLTNGVTLPAYKVYFINALQAHNYVSQDPDSLTIEQTINADDIDHLAAYFFADRWLLLPDKWKITSAMIAANGTQFISFAPPKLHGHFQYWTNNAACYGCGLDAASIFFANADAIHQSYYGASSLQKNIPTNINVVDIRPNTKAWRMRVKQQNLQQNIDGIIYWHEASGDSTHIQLSLPAPYEPLVTPILNWYMPDE